MRLDSNEVEIVKTAVETLISKESEVRVFGSRLNDSMRGGDLDLGISKNRLRDGSEQFARSGWTSEVQRIQGDTVN